MAGVNASGVHVGVNLGRIEARVELVKVLGHRDLELFALDRVWSANDKLDRVVLRLRQTDWECLFKKKYCGMKKESILTSA